MTAKLIDGKAMALALRERVAEKVRRLHNPPGLGVVLVGDDPASAIYVGRKEKAAADAGLKSQTIRLPATASQAAVMEAVDRFNADPAMHAILVQLPMPKAIDATAILDRLNPAKDVDGFHPMNVGLLQEGRARLVPGTPLGCLRLLQGMGVALKGARALVLGRSRVVGRPMAALLLAENCTVTIGHSASRDLPDLIREADILVSSIGKPAFVKGDWIKPGAVVIDVGINRLADGTLAGDVEFAAACQRAALITPVPGGVGPMTIACLLRNAALASALQQDEIGVAEELLAL